MKLSDEQVFYAERIIEDVRNYVLYDYLEERSIDLCDFARASVCILITTNHFHPIHAVTLKADDLSDKVSSYDIGYFSVVNNNDKKYTVGMINIIVEDILSDLKKYGQKDKRRDTIDDWKIIALYALIIMIKDISDLYSTIDSIGKDEDINDISDGVRNPHTLSLIECIVLKWHHRYLEDFYGLRCRKHSKGLQTEWDTFDEDKISPMESLREYEYMCELMSLCLTYHSRSCKEDIIYPSIVSFENNFKLYHMGIHSIPPRTMEDRRSKERDYIKGDDICIRGPMFMSVCEHEVYEKLRKKKKVSMSDYIDAKNVVIVTDETKVFNCIDYDSLLYSARDLFLMIFHEIRHVDQYINPDIRYEISLASVKERAESLIDSLSDDKVDSISTIRDVDKELLKSLREPCIYNLSTIYDIYKDDPENLDSELDAEMYAFSMCANIWMGNLDLCDQISKEGVYDTALKYFNVKNMIDYLNLTNEEFTKIALLKPKYRYDAREIIRIMEKKAKEREKDENK